MLVVVVFVAGLVWDEALRMFWTTRPHTTAGQKRSAIQMGEYRTGASRATNWQLFSLRYSRPCWEWMPTT